MTDVNMNEVIALTIGGNTKRSKTGQHSVEVPLALLPAESLAFVIRYGLKQYLADGMAGATTEAEAAEGIAARMEKLAKADFSRTRGESGPTDDVATLAKRIAREEVQTKVKAHGVKLPKERMAEIVAALFERDEKRLRTEAEKRIKARNDAVEGMSIDELLGDVLGITGEADEA